MTFLFGTLTCKTPFSASRATTTQWSVSNGCQEPIKSSQLIYQVLSACGTSAPLLLYNHSTAPWTRSSAWRLRRHPSALLLEVDDSFFTITMSPLATILQMMNLVFACSTTLSSIHLSQRIQSASKYGMLQTDPLCQCSVVSQSQRSPRFAWTSVTVSSLSVTKRAAPVVWTLRMAKRSSHSRRKTSAQIKKKSLSQASNIGVWAKVKKKRQSKT